MALAATAIAGRADTPAVAVPDSVSLGEVTVRARRPFEQVIPAQTLAGDRLEALRSQSVADALRYFSGVQIKDYGGVGGVKTVDMRSMGTNHMGVFYDGIQLGNAQNGQIDLGKFSLDNLEAIDMYNGQKSDIFQSAKDFGSAGTLYLQSRRPEFDDGERWKGNATFRTGSFGLVNPSLRFDYKLSERVTATVSAEYTYATGRYKFRYRRLYTDHTVAWDTTAVRKNGGINALRAEAGVYGTLPRGYWQGKLYYYDSSRGIPGAIVNNVWKNSQKQWDRNFFVQGRFRKTLSNLYALQVNAKYARDYMRYLNPDTTLMYIDNEFWQHETYISVANRLSPLKWLDINASADWQWNKLDATLANFSRPVRHTILGALAAAVNQGPFRGQASMLWTHVTDRITLASAEHPGRTSRFSRLTPAVFVSWQPSRPLTLRAFYKRIFRMPTFNDLYYTDIGNADLKPEYATQWNVGAVFQRDFPSVWFNSLNLTLDAYYNKVTDKIIAVPKGTGQYRWMMMNIGKVKILGTDLTANLRFTIAGQVYLLGRLTYTFQRAMDFSDPTDTRPGGAGTYKGQIAYIPRHSGSVAGTLQWRRAELNYSFIYVGERYHNSSNIRENYEPSWYTHDLSASYRIPMSGRRPSTLKLGLEINNLFNQQYEVIQNYPMPGRNFKIILTYDI
ncbi:MAG: TonB-dependent receptor [Bacteroides sp.]|nr:TonB-dependent receptor [Bacteroidales bacterium]MBD5317301.1 TonB-dependent receptor [Bacteroides sp.]